MSEQLRRTFTVFVVILHSIHPCMDVNLANKSIVPWSVDPSHLPGQGRVFTLAALLDRQRLQVVPQGAHSNVHLLDEETLHVFQHKLGH